MAMITGKGKTGIPRRDEGLRKHCDSTTDCISKDLLFQDSEQGPNESATNR
ncbi:hypothetical protein HGO38_27170 [Rhizobium sp. CG5]|uniref:hypothetical protein n=1 Tax=Rhizobium sp. CG5 TaxID=2726076 RepID=UPI00203359E6|nr:hypothetical protein [Rhizobium sp. CG5]MCM2477138.1 hypothetical protein [Rhizobium sp. CG5]